MFRHPFSAEIGFHDDGIVDDVHRRSVSDDHAVVEHAELIADLWEWVRRVPDDQYGPAFRREALDDDEEARTRLVRETGERLVEQHESRRPGERAGELEQAQSDRVEPARESGGVVREADG